MNNKKELIKKISALKKMLKTQSTFLSNPMQTELLEKIESEIIFLSEKLNERG